MAYTLYPYYWAYRDDWAEILKTNSNADFIFQAFLQSGMAKMVVPVRAGYEKAVMYYLDTGAIVNSNDIITDGEDGLYQAVCDKLELETDDDGNPKIEAEWETRIPSSLVIIQNNSNPLERNGLPCSCPDKDAEANIIGGVKDGETPNQLGVIIDESNIG